LEAAARLWETFARVARAAARLVVAAAMAAWALPVLARAAARLVEAAFTLAAAATRLVEASSKAAGGVWAWAKKVPHRMIDKTDVKNIFVLVVILLPAPGAIDPTPPAESG